MALLRRLNVVWLVGSFSTCLKGVGLPRSRARCVPVFMSLFPPSASIANRIEKLLQDLYGRRGQISLGKLVQGVFFDF
jgi:hypothetical protein